MTERRRVWRDPMAEELADDDPVPFDGWAVLLRAIEDRRPEWQADAACRDHPEVSWFPEKGQSLEPARAICAECLCAAECESYALELDTVHGVWAGESARRLRRSRAA